MRTVRKEESGSGNVGLVIVLASLICAVALILIFAMKSVLMGFMVFVGYLLLAVVVFSVFSITFGSLSAFENTNKLAGETAVAGSAAASIERSVQRKRAHR